MSDNTVLTLQVLNSDGFSMDKLKSLLSGDKRRFERDIQKLISLNRKAFDFLGIEARGNYDDSFNYSLRLDSSEYSGVIPIRSAGSGLISGYLKVTGRYGEEIDDVLPLLRDENFTPEFDDSMPISIDAAVAPPKYIECAKYIDIYEQAERFHWQKFSNRNLTQSRPRNTDWVRYSLDSFDPSNALIYPNKINLLTTDHTEWMVLQYVLDLAISELKSLKTPISLRMHYANDLERLGRCYDKGAIIPADHITIHSSDPVIIKELKNIANLILEDSSDIPCAWRIDYSRFFERYIQYLFTLLAHKRGARIVNNPHYSISGKKPAWALKYLEPDIVMIKEGDQVIIDAKYKSHMYNWDSNSEELHNTFQEDFHQVLAYSSFNTMQRKKTIIVYPYNEFRRYSTTAHSNLNECENVAYLIGIPISKAKIPEVVDSLQEIV
jgi:hypothetical protein